MTKEEKKKKIEEKMDKYFKSDKFKRLQRYCFGRPVEWYERKDAYPSIEKLYCRFTHQEEP